MQVLTNLVSNAVKFTPRGGEITISARIDPIDAVTSLDERRSPPGPSTITGKTHNDSFSAVRSCEEAEAGDSNDTTGRRRYGCLLGDGTPTGGSRIASSDSHPASPGGSVGANVDASTAVSLPAHDSVTPALEAGTDARNKAGKGRVGKGLSPLSVSSDSAPYSRAAALGNHGASFEREKRGTTENDGESKRSLLVLSVKDSGHGINPEDVPRCSLRCGTPVGVRARHIFFRVRGLSRCRSFARRGCFRCAIVRAGCSSGRVRSFAQGSPRPSQRDTALQGRVFRFQAGPGIVYGAAQGISAALGGS